MAKITSVDYLVDGGGEDYVDQLADAASKLGYATAPDPSCEDSDMAGILIAKDKATLNKAVKALRNFEIEMGDEENFDEKEAEKNLEEATGDLAYAQIVQDWKSWDDWKGDAKVLKSIGLKLKLIDDDGHFELSKI